MSAAEELKISSFEGNLGNLDLEDKNYDAASDELKKLGLKILYETRMDVLTRFQWRLYMKLLAKIPKDIVLFVDPIVLSFALRDACDLSGASYVWLDLEGDDEVGSSVWTKEQDVNSILALAVDLLRRHLEKYLIDVYSHDLREEMVRVWEAGLGLEVCGVCGKTSLKRRVIVVAKNNKLRGWACSNCGNHIVIPSDALDYLNKVGGSA